MIIVLSTCKNEEKTLSGSMKASQRNQKWAFRNRNKLISKIIEGVKFINGEIEKPETKAA